MSARRTANRFRERARHQMVNCRRSSAYASLVSPRYPARNPAGASRSASVKAGWIMTRAVDGAAVVIGHLPAGLRPEKLGQLRIPAIERKFKPKPPGQSRYVTVLYRAGRGRLRDTPSCRIWRVGSSHGKAIARTQKCQFWLHSARDGEVFPLGKPVP